MFLLYPRIALYHCVRGVAYLRGFRALCPSDGKWPLSFG